MSAHVLLNLLNKLRKSNKKRDLLSFFCFFATSLMYTGKRKLDFMYHMTLKSLINHIFA